METFPGIYRAQVRRTDDPEGRDRLIVVVPSLNGMGELDWAMPCVMPLTTTVSVGGTADPHTHVAVTRPKLPVVGDPVWVMFEHGNIDNPVWLGTWRVL